MIENEIKKYSYSCMSNAKWRKLFSVINEQNLKLHKCVWKIVGNKEPQKGFVPDCSQLGDTFVGDCGALNGPLEYKFIEWVFIPRTTEYREYECAPVNSIDQDIEFVVEQLNSLGNFELELSSDGLKIFGYKP